MKREAIIVPEGCRGLLLHACCAPCSSAIVEWLVQHEVRPTIFYYNPNIFPREEYEIRKNESKRHAESLGLEWIDGDYDHEGWLQGVCGLEHEPERGRRCELCFTLRLTAAARKAQELGIPYFATTLASSRWKSLEQINRAGNLAEQMVNAQRSTLNVQRSTFNAQRSTFNAQRSTFNVQRSTFNAQRSTFNAQRSTFNAQRSTFNVQRSTPNVQRSTFNAQRSTFNVAFWPQNWRKGGLQERRNQLLREYGFYNQQYCGCEFSMKRQ